jgi:hypothetical protein
MRAAFLLAVGLPLSAQSPPPVPLTGKTERLAHAFTSVDGLAELPDGRLVLVDSKDRTVWLGDLASGRVVQVSRRGSGPLEYQQPRGVFALVDGGVVLADPGNARFLRLSSDGRVQGPWRPVNGAGREVSLSNLAFAWDARAVDARGRLYYEVLPPPLDPGQSATVPIIRYDLANARECTAANAKECRRSTIPRSSPSIFWTTVRTRGPRWPHLGQSSRTRDGLGSDHRRLCRRRKNRGARFPLTSTAAVGADREVHVPGVSRSG